MRKLTILLIAILGLSFYSCKKDSDVIPTILDSLKSDSVLTDSDIAQGLKDALKVGTDTSVNIVSAIDGFYKDELIKILLPPEASQVVEFANKVPGLDNIIENAILSMNRAAEDAAKEAAPIFVNAITSMTITDAVNILHGEDTAATHYLKENTYANLFDAFQPKINNSLDKGLIGVKSTNDLWNEATSMWNDYVIGSTVFGVQPFGHKTIDIDLSEHVTTKGLHGLFTKVAEEEKDIRLDPLARVTDILKKVFAELD